MAGKALEALEFPKILERLAQHTSFSVGRELALGLRPATEFEEAFRLQQLTAEAKRLLEARPSISLASARDVRSIAQRASLGGTLEPAELLDVAATLACGRYIHSVLVRLRAQAPLLAEIAARISLQAELEGEIGRCITPTGEVATDASPLLRRIRAEARSAHQRLIERLEELVSSSAMRHVIQEPIVTQREGRYVIPIKTDFKGQFRGIVHDQSASGATVFVEPLEAVPLNNRWRELQIEEQREVQRVLRSLSNAVGAVAGELIESVNALAEIDVVLAKARFALSLQATQPRLLGNEQSEIDRGLQESSLILKLINARHPLLGSSAVPITVHLGGDFFILLITGPNTGGKTVALKTVGLLALMAQCGVQIPAEDGSAIRVFNRVFADIGDEQSIEQSLSTFSSHMRNIVTVLNEANSASLVLLDELGAGTDPAEGAALARAVLQYLTKRKVPTIATSHYSELKAFANVTPGLRNACVEFDPETLAPTYHLSIGLPGRSNAIAIAKRLGVPDEVIEAAQGFLDPIQVQTDRLLAEIQLERDRIEMERKAVEHLRIETDSLKQELERALKAIEDERFTVAEKVWREIEEEVIQVRQRLAAALELERKRVVPEKIIAAIGDLKEVERNVAAKIAAQIVQRAGGSADSAAMRAGDRVYVRSVQQYGELAWLSDDRREAEVRLGNFKLRVRAGDIEPAHAGGNRTRDSVTGKTEIRLAGREAPPPEIEVRAWRVEQVLPALEEYIHAAFVAGLPQVRVIHGKGTGVLRQAVREQLARNPLVRSFRTADPRDGGEGVTVVELAL